MCAHACRNANEVIQDLACLNENSYGHAHGVVEKNPCTYLIEDGQRLDAHKFGDHETYRKHGQVWHQPVCGTFGNTNVSNGTQGNTHNCKCHHSYMTNLVVSLCAQFKNMQGDSESQELA